ncbi:hypothetical protein AUR64_16470 [Haloprofundus marisrubri]|uniref:DUF8100 domain-containing protein n=1 Tax=Haloprofundus marisrubri TaxID=1514971 RepID=A0A0W1R7H3_9EURY|nr:hypothetical protein [Haloprofundus marisrubri]KTG09373.1 hypothetical protein AUR64_16470 [Haloprofundus marisrubri]
MGRFSDRWFDRFSDEWNDISSVKVFLTSLGMTVLNAVLFVLFFALVDPPVQTGQASAVGSLIVIFFGLCVGAASPLHSTNERLSDLASTFWYRGLWLAIVYGGYVALLLYTVVYGIWFALTFLVGKVVTVTGLFAYKRLAQQ